MNNLDTLWRRLLALVLLLALLIAGRFSAQGQNGGTKPFLRGGSRPVTVPQCSAGAARLSR